MILEHNGVEQDFPYISETGPVPAMGDSYYDGILEAHNDKYFLTLTGDQAYYKTSPGLDKNGKYSIAGKWEYVGMEVSKRSDADAWEGLFWVYEIDETLRSILAGVSDWDCKARNYAESNLTPVGYTGEYDLERI